MSLAHISTPARNLPKRTNFAARLGMVAALAIAALTSVAALPSPATATPSTHGAPSGSGGQQAKHAHKAHQATEAERFQAKAHRVIREARKQRGKPYEYGADGPHAFDCSGLVRFVFLHSLHRSLPHNAAEQYRVSEHIRRSHLRVGDLVFVDNGGHVSHVGIFAGHHHWWVAPHTGTHVKLQRIYAAHFVYGRIIRWPHH